MKEILNGKPLYEVKITMSQVIDYDGAETLERLYFSLSNAVREADRFWRCNDVTEVVVLCDLTGEVLYHYYSTAEEPYGFYVSDRVRLMWRGTGKEM